METISNPDTLKDAYDATQPHVLHVKVRSYTPKLVQTQMFSYNIAIPISPTTAIWRQDR
jgi:hypothetical protein